MNEVSDIMVQQQMQLYFSNKINSETELFPYKKSDLVYVAMETKKPFPFMPGSDHEHAVKSEHNNCRKNIHCYKISVKSTDLCMSDAEYDLIVLFHF